MLVIFIFKQIFILLHIIITRKYFCRNNSITTPKIQISVFSFYEIIDVRNEIEIVFFVISIKSIKLNKIK